MTPKIIEAGIDIMVNKAPRRKRTGYQSGLKTNLDFGEHVVSPKPPSAYFTPPQADGVLKKHNKTDLLNRYSNIPIYIHGSNMQIALGTPKAQKIAPNQVGTFLLGFQS